MPLWNSVTYASIDADDPRSLDHIRNPYYKFFKDVPNEQQLLNSMVAEAIQFGGVEFYYVKRDMPNLDYIFGEDTTNTFKDFWKIAAYVETFDGWQGQGDFYTKFGMVVNDEATVIIQPDLFSYQTGGYTAKPGDLLIWPQKTATADFTLFEIIWVEPNNPFHPNGVLPFRRLNIQKFAYSNEKLELVNKSPVPDPEGTDLPEEFLDELIVFDTRGDTAMPPYVENDQIQTEGDDITVFDEDNPFGARY